jgi:phosphate:Na+ symporter
MDIFGVLSMLGGLAFFLFGMNAMGDGLAKLSGGRLERLLEKLTSNRLMAVLLGAGVTAVIQSSSATTVMVVGFVNSGIMKLSQAVGIIMGANVGTTITSWILSLTSISGDSLVMKLLKPTSFSPVLAVIGVILLLFSKKENHKDIGTILVGFAILMYGMSTMSDAVKPLAEVEEFTNILTMFSNPILGMIAGAVLTAVIQSSSASVGILQALCVTGSVSYSVALPIIMGQNIGTCVTAMISSIGTSKNAKRAACVHLYFNVIGTVVFMVVFYAINAFVNFSILSEPANAAGIAVIHSLFNIIATLILFPFAGLLEKLAVLTIRDKEEEKDEHDDLSKLLDERFLDKPGFAIEQCRNVTIQMAETTKKSLFSAMGLLEKYDEQVAENVVELENTVDKYEDILGTYLVKLSSRQLSMADSRTLSILLHSIGDLERISDHALNIKESAEEMHDKGLTFSAQAKEEIEVFSRAIRDIVTEAIDTFVHADAEKAKRIEPLEQVVDYLNIEVRQRHVARLRKGECTIELGFVLSDICTNYERVADHCSNIGVCLIQVSEDGFDTHEYLDELTDESNEAFTRECKALQKNYKLPKVG